MRIDEKISISLVTFIRLRLIRNQAWLKSHRAAFEQVLDRNVRFSKRNNFSPQEGERFEEAKGRETDSSLETGWKQA